MRSLCALALPRPRSTRVAAAADIEVPIVRAAIARTRLRARRGIGTPWSNGRATGRPRIDNGGCSRLSASRTESFEYRASGQALSWDAHPPGPRLGLSEERAGPRLSAVV